MLALCHAILLSGCTHTLWEQERFAHSHWPANPPNLRLFYSESTRDLLAEYDEQTQGTTVLRRRAYWLEPNATQVAAGQPPQFVSTTNAQDLVVVPITDNLTNPPASKYHDLYAVVSTDGQSFTLCPLQRQPITYGLPVYFTGSGQRVKQVLLTPFAVTTDVIIVGGCVAVVGGVAFVIAACQGHAFWCPNDPH